ncbi:F-box protein CPR1-like [Spinacia oleracea]|uniref:F-box protein CPR1-like n=1 Tax=Spinacia oleracea TaxID=3562 RepID=A0ABM3QUX7_SPIOL|nr:F-box protein CPR1-like [Spinacia oleracea]
MEICTGLHAKDMIWLLLLIFIMSFDLGLENCRKVEQPEYGDIHFDMTLGLIGGSLCIICTYRERGADIWMMSDNIQWCKIISLTELRPIHHYDLIKPLIYSRNGSEILLELDNERFIWYNLQKKLVREVNIRQLPTELFGTEVFCGSLLDPEYIGAKMILAALPVKVQCYIFSQLPVKTLGQAQCVCKTWYNFINGPEFYKMHLEVLKKCDDSGLLLILKGERFLSVKAQLLDKAIEINHPLLSNKEYTDIVGSCNGLICLCNNQNQNFALWNPCTGKHEKVPHPDFHVKNFLTHGFGYDSTTDDYKVVSILQQHNRLKGGTVDTEVEVYSMKTRSRKLIQQFSYLVCNPCNGIFANGALHWVARQSPNLYSGSDLVIAFDLGVEKCRVVKQPNYVDTNFHMSLGLLGGNLCILCHYPKESFDLWVMADYQTESWTKLVSISQPNVIRCFEYMKPLAYSKDGSEVLFEQDNEKLFWYNLRKKTVEYVNITGVPKSFDSVMCSSSLVPFGNGTRKYEVIHGEPTMHPKPK